MAEGEEESERAEGERCGCTASKSQYPARAYTAVGRIQGREGPPARPGRRGEAPAAGTGHEGRVRMYRERVTVSGTSLYGSGPHLRVGSRSSGKFGEGGKGTGLIGNRPDLLREVRISLTVAGWSGSGRGRESWSGGPGVRTPECD